MCPAQLSKGACAILLLAQLHIYMGIEHWVGKCAKVRSVMCGASRHSFTLKSLRICANLLPLQFCSNFNSTWFYRMHSVKWM